ncbi:MAG: DegV family protein [Anaerolineae bacterium]
MARTAIATDSTAGLPAELVERYHIHVIPLNVLFGQESLRDNVDITTEEFYQRLKTVKDALPTTSQPSAGAFREFYEAIAKEADAIVSIHISADLSGTVASALQAKDMLPHIPIYVVDSRFTSMALGYIVLEAARAAEAGASPEEIVAAAQAVIPRMRVYFAVDTLRYLHMGGRIGGGAAFLGTALDIKPILELRDGKIEAAGKARTMKRAAAKLVELLVGQFGEGARIRAATIGAAAPEAAQQLAEQIRQRFDCVEMYTTDLSPVIGTHVGPGTIGAMGYPV